MTSCILGTHISWHTERHIPGHSKHYVRLHENLISYSFVQVRRLYMSQKNYKIVLSENVLCIHPCFTGINKLRKGNHISSFEMCLSIRPSVYLLLLFGVWKVWKMVSPFASIRRNGFLILPSSSKLPSSKYESKRWMTANSLFYRQSNSYIWLALQTSYIQYIRAYWKRKAFTSLKNVFRKFTGFVTTCCAVINLWIF